MLAIAPVVGAALISGGLSTLGGLLGGIGKGKNKRKAIQFLMQALQRARASEAAQGQIVARNQAGIGNIQNRFQSALGPGGLGRERITPDLSNLFGASIGSNPFAQALNPINTGQGPVSFDPTGGGGGSTNIAPLAALQPPATTADRQGSGTGGGRINDDDDDRELL